MLVTSYFCLDLLLLIALLFLAYKYLTRNYDYWEKRKVFYKKPILLFGNFMNVFLLKTTISERLAELYNSTNDPYLGIYILDQPCLVIKDPNLVKKILVKDFDNFCDRPGAKPAHNVLMDYFLFLQKNPTWKTTRSKLTQVFSSRRLKGMFPILKDVGDEFVDYIKKKEGILEAKELFSHYTTEVVARCFFGVHGQTFINENTAFKMVSKQMFDTTLRNALSSLAYFFKQDFVRWFRLEFVPKCVQDDLNDIFWKVINHRKTSEVRLNDFVDILGDMIKNQDFSDASQHDKDRLTGAVIQFYAGGNETTSTTSSFTLYELALNTTLQTKLRNEIMENVKRNNGLTYEGFYEMEYLKMCINETIRKYPVLPFLDRQCKSNYQIPGTNLVIEKDLAVYIPLLGLHMDEKYFPEPQKYIPERFANHKLYNEDGMTFLPFGGGPRNCIGTRFGLISVGMSLISVILNFEVKVCPATPISVEFSPKCFLLTSKVGLPLSFVPLSQDK